MESDDQDSKHLPVSATGLDGKEPLDNTEGKDGYANKSRPDKVKTSIEDVPTRFRLRSIAVVVQTDQDDDDVKESPSPRSFGAVYLTVLIIDDRSDD